MRGSLKFIFFSSFGAFTTYFSMYAFRKPFTAALFEDLTFLGIDYKIFLVTLQLIGYASAKVFGIKFIAELKVLTSVQKLSKKLKK